VVGAFVAMELDSSTKEGQLSHACGDTNYEMMQFSISFDPNIGTFVCALSHHWADISNLLVCQTCTFFAMSFCQ